MKTKLIIAFLLHFMFNYTFSQNKKEQIITLNYRIDSLKQIINTNNTQIKNNSVVILDLESQILRQKSIIEENKLEAIKLKNTLSEKETEIIVLRDSIAGFNQKSDSIFWEINDLTWQQLEFDLKFEFPVNKFQKPSGLIMVSKNEKIKIEIDYNFTHWSEQEENSPLFFKLKDAIDFYSKNLHDVEIYENNGFVIKGKNSLNELIIIKGIYSEFKSMQGREKGAPDWLWSNTIVLKAEVKGNDVKEYNNISNLLINGFTANSIIYK
jgi:hypothetical protein